MKEQMCCALCKNPKPTEELVFVVRGNVATPICKIHPHPKDLEVETKEG